MVRVMYWFRGVVRAGDFPHRSVGSRLVLVLGGVWRRFRPLIDKISKIKRVEQIKKIRTIGPSRKVIPAKPPFRF